MDGRNDTHTIISRTKNPLFCGFLSSTKPTGVIGTIEQVIDSDEGFHMRDNGYTPKGSYHGIYHSSRGIISVIIGGSGSGSGRDVWRKTGTAVASEKYGRASSKRSSLNRGSGHRAQE